MDMLWGQLIMRGNKIVVKYVDFEVIILKLLLKEVIMFDSLYSILQIVYNR